MARFDLRDEECAVIAPLLPIDGREPKRRDDRTILNGIFYILRTGAPWRDLPGRYGSHDHPQIAKDISFKFEFTMRCDLNKLRQIPAITYNQPY